MALFNSVPYITYSDMRFTDSDFALAWGDVDNDGINELLVAPFMITGTDQPVFLTYTGTEFSDKNIVISDGGFASTTGAGFEIFDIDNDGQKEVLFLNNSDALNQILEIWKYSDGALHQLGTPLTGFSDMAPITDISAAKISDINYLFAVDSTLVQVAIYNLSDTTAAPTVFTPSAVLQISGVNVRDIDCDGQLEMALFTYDGSGGSTSQMQFFRLADSADLTSWSDVDILPSSAPFGLPLSVVFANIGSACRFDLVATDQSTSPADILVYQNLSNTISNFQLATSDGTPIFGFVCCQADIVATWEFNNPVAPCSDGNNVGFITLTRPDFSETTYTLASDTNSVTFLGSDCQVGPGAITFFRQCSCCSDVCDFFPIPLVFVSAAVDAGSDQTITAGSDAVIGTGSALSDVTYTWSPSDTISDAGAFPTTAYPTVTTTYTVIAQNIFVSGCSSSDSVTITVSDFGSGPIACSLVISDLQGGPVCTNALFDIAFSFEGVSDAHCTLTFDNSDYVSDFAAGTHSFNVQAPSFASDYIATLSAFNLLNSDCSDVKTTIITVDAPVSDLTIAVTPSDAVCPGTAVTLTASGAHHYVWFDGTSDNPYADFTPTQTSDYTVTGFSQNKACSSDVSISITVKQRPVVTISATSDTVCSGNTVTLTALGAQTYIWFDNSTSDSLTFTPTVSSDYLVTGTSDDCSSDASVLITVDTPVSDISVTVSPSDTICPGTAVTLTASGAHHYVWFDGTSDNPYVDFIPTQTSDYGVTGFSQNEACFSDAVVHITVKQRPVVTVEADSDTMCLGTTVTLTASGAETYLWFDGSDGSVHSFIPTESSDYHVTGTSDDCSSDASVLITVDTPVSDISVTVSPSDTICPGTAVTLTASGAHHYVWFDGTSDNPYVDFIPTQTSDYGVTGFSQNEACFSDAVVHITVKQRPVVTVEADSDTMCLGTTVTLTASGAETYLWFDGSDGSVHSFIPTESSDYTVTGTSDGCSSDASVLITVDTPVSDISVTVSPSDTICPGTAVTLTASGAHHYVWFDGTSDNPYVDFIPTQTSDYGVTGFSQNEACFSDASVSITVKQRPVITISASSDVICAGKPVMLTASGALTYVWFDGASDNPHTFIPPATSDYRVMGTSDGCSSDAFKHIIIKTPVTVNAGLDQTISAGSGAPIGVGPALSDVLYTWSPSDGISNVNAFPTTAHPTFTTTYTVIAQRTDVSDCTSSDSVIVDVLCFMKLSDIHFTGDTLNGFQFSNKDGTRIITATYRPPQ